MNTNREARTPEARTVIFRYILRLMSSRRVRFTSLAIVFLGASALAASAQTATAPQLPARYLEPIPLYTTALGTFTRPISSTNKDAQAFFTQGFQMMYAFAKPEA